MLSVIYKMASAALANRIKPLLPILIPSTQTGFIKDRFIGDSTRLIYDLIHTVEEKKLVGLLMLIDFEKAFDSISWKFLYKCLEKFNFGEDFIKWIKILNTNIKASVMQMGILSQFFYILRGCRQGDPIAPYLFILCANVLLYLIYSNKNIKGIIIDGTEFKLNQFADDTTLLFDGSRDSL